MGIIVVFIFLKSFLCEHTYELSGSFFVCVHTSELTHVRCMYVCPDARTALLLTHRRRRLRRCVVSAARCAKRTPLRVHVNVHARGPASFHTYIVVRQSRACESPIECALCVVRVRHAIESVRRHTWMNTSEPARHFLGCSGRAVRRVRCAFDACAPCPITFRECKNCKTEPRTKTYMRHAHTKTHAHTRTHEHTQTAHRTLSRRALCVRNGNGELASASAHNSNVCAFVFLHTHAHTRTQTRCTCKKNMRACTCFTNRWAVERRKHTHTNTQHNTHSEHVDVVGVAVAYDEKTTRV